MLAAFKAIRYTVFGESSLVSSSWQRRVLTNHYFQGFFVICNATIASVAVWNMSIVQFMDWKRTLPLERDSTRMSILTLTYRSLFDANRRLFDLFGVFWVGLDTTSVRHLEIRCLHPYSWSVTGSFSNFLRRMSYWVGYGLNVHGPLCSGLWNLVGSTVF